jgi:hypothetical protein
MSTQAEMKQLLQQMAARHPDVGVWKRGLVLKPVRHFMRIVHLENTSGTTGFRPQWGVCETFHTRDRFHPSYMTHFRELNSFSLYLDDPGMSEQLYGCIDDVALPALRALATYDDCMHFIDGPLFPDGHRTYADYARTLLDIAGGHIDRAREPLELLASYAKVWRGSYMEPFAGPIIDDLKPLVDSNDRKAIGALLRQWEERWIRKNKLEKLWEPTPFPVEVG